MKLAWRSHSSLFFLLIAMVSQVGCSQTEIPPETHFENAQKFFDNREFLAAQTELSNALQQDPGMLNARWLLAQVALEISDGAKAEKEIKRAMELGLTRSSGLPKLAQAITLQGDPERLLKETNSLPEGMPKPDQALILSLRAEAYMQTQKLEQAEKELVQAFALNTGLAEPLLSKALLHFVKRELDQSRSLIDQAVKINDALPQLWALLGQIELIEGNGAAAEDAFGKAAKLRRTPSLDLAKRAHARVMQKKYAEAEADIKEIKKSPLKNHFYVNYVAGLSAFYQNRFTDARDALELSKSVFSNHLPTRFYLATTYLLLGNRELARDNAETARSLSPGSLKVRRLYGAVAASERDFDHAVEILENALLDSPDDLLILTMLGNISLERRDADKAIEYFERALAMQPEVGELKDKLLLAKFIRGDSLAGSTTDQQGDDYTASFLRALQAFKENKPQEALKQSEALHERFPEKVDPINLMAACHLRMGQWDMARSKFHKVLKMEPHQASAARNLANLELRQGNLEQAQSLLRGLLDQTPNDEQAVLLLHKVENRLGHPERGQQVLEKTVEAVPDALQVRTELAHVYLSQRSYNKVLNLTTGLTKEEVQRAPALLGLRGMAQMATGNSASARDSFKEWIEYAPTHAPAHFYYAESLAAAGDLEQVAQELQRAIELDQGFVKAHVGEIKLLVKLEKLEEARQRLTKLKEEFGDQFEVLSIEGWFALGTGEYARAEAAFAAASQLKPNREITLYHAKSLVLQRKFDQALLLMQEWVNQHPDDIAVLTQLADTYLILKQDEDAKTTYAKLIELNPNHISALNNFAWLTRNQDLEKATSYAQKAFTLNPENPYLLNTYGKLLLLKKEAEKGLRYVEMAANQMPGNEEFQLHYAQALIQTENSHKAQEILSKLVQQALDKSVVDQAKELLDRMETP